MIIIVFFVKIDDKIKRKHNILYLDEKYINKEKETRLLSPSTV